MIGHKSSFPFGVAFGLILVSITFCVGVFVFDAGLNATPYTTTDSLGREMGFNDPLSSEHYRIAIGSFRFSTLLQLDYLYAWVLFFAQIWGLMKVGQAWRREAILGWKYFALQSVLFPFGWFGLVYIPYLIGRIGEGALDREGVIDVPFIAFTAQTLWLVVSTMIAFLAWSCFRKGQA